MTRSKTDPAEPEQTTTTAVVEAPKLEPVEAPPAAAPAAAPDPANLYEPYPGDTFFHGGRHSPIVAAMGGRLAQEGCTDGRHLGPDWTNAHRDAFATWQHQLRPKGAGDVSGIPDDIAWDRLKVPRVSPLPLES